jgi:hypothetical protein
MALKRWPSLAPPAVNVANMPYRSVAQRAFMHAQHPDIAARWDAEYGGKIVKAKKKKDKPKKPKADYTAGYLKSYGK